jgi:hypothetical protein
MLRLKHNTRPIGQLKTLLGYPRTVVRRMSRARVRMMSSSFWTVAAATGASTQVPSLLTWREAAWRGACGGGWGETRVAGRKDL